METKYYPLYRVDICAESYAIHYCIVGAESVEDLLAHWKKIFKEYHTTKNMRRASNIMPIPYAYTTKPYSVIDSYAYFE